MYMYLHSFHLSMYTIPAGSEEATPKGAAEKSSTLFTHVQSYESLCEGFTLSDIQI